jgi:PAS domain-containing protein
VRTDQDMTERKQAKQEPAESEVRYRALVDSSPSAIIVDRNGKVCLANPARASRAHSPTGMRTMPKNPVMTITSPSA